MSRVTMRLRSDFHRLGDSLMKITLFRFVANGWLAFVNVSRDFYLARMILLGDHHVASPHRNH
ncbi:hypothetical protein [Oscillatoria sp. HE19RPO]|uniref:hypothetical protein n=1 Tax=Oscillatoria sp. HE19RPO TaxID=2954806 RepID=UPI0020C27945|nr:hypothetical protein [Oscillatoria sp. HE19RPO]